MSEKVLFEGVVVGFEKEADQFLVSIQGSVNDKATSFYLIVDQGTFDELARLGVGRMIRGEAFKENDNPLRLKLIKLYSS